VARNALGAVDAFKNDVKVAVRQTLAGLDRGTVGIGKDCLWGMAVGKISKSANGPKGTNAAFYARQAFDEVVSSPAFSNFVY